MEKLVYLCWKGDESAPAFRTRLLQEVCPRLLEQGARSLTLNVADLGAEIEGSPLVRGEGATLSAAVSLWLDSIDLRPPLEGALRSATSKLWGYLVTESVPMRWAGRDWPDGVRSPGVTLVTTFPKPDRLDDDRFFAHWYGKHTPLSFEVHPFVQYVRNSVARVLTPGAPGYRGIVEERVRELRDVLDLERFFRGAAENMQRAMEDVEQFLDVDQVHCTLMSEYILKSS